MATTADPSNPADGSQKRALLFVVDAEEVAAVLALPLAPHETVFDDALLHDLVARSFSITRAEKEEIIRSLSRFSQAQIEALVQILTDERQKFQELNARHARRLAELDEQGKARDAEEEILALFRSH